MTAERLREAARVLRERVDEVSRVTPGTWRVHREPGLGYVVANDDGWVGVIGDQEGDSEAATYIATMSPPVALALTDVLNHTADAWEMTEAHGKKFAPGRIKVIASLADAILGGVS